MMKLLVVSFSKFVLINLVLSQYCKYGISAVKLELHTFVPDTLRQAKHGINQLLRRKPIPPVLVIPQRTGISSIDKALFQASIIGTTMQGSLSRQVTTLMMSKSVAPNMFMVLLSLFPDHIVSNMLTAAATTEQAASVKAGFQYLQTIFRVLVSSQIIQMAFVTLNDVIMNHASIVNPTVKKVIEFVPSAIPQIAILTLMMHGLMKFYNAVVRPRFHKELSTSTTSMSQFTADNENEFVATFTPIHFEKDDSLIVTDVAQDPEFMTMQTSNESTKNDSSLEVSVTKISAVLDRFESKILSLVGGTRFHPSLASSEEDEGTEQEAETSATEVLNETASFDEGPALNNYADVIDLSNDSSVHEPDEIVVQTMDVNAEEKTESVSMEACFPSLKSYEIPLSSPSLSPLWSTMTTPSSKAAVRALGVIACALFSENVMPSIVRNVVVACATVFVVGMIVQEVRGAFSNSKHTDSLDTLIHEIESRTTAYANEMEPLVVASRPTSRSSLRFWSTRVPILDSIASFSSNFMSLNAKEDDITAESDIIDTQEDIVAESLDFETDVHFYDETPEEASTAIPSPPKNVWRWMSPSYAQPKMTRTACTAIVGM